MKNVLADWPDREALALLQRCGEAARPAGRVVVLGGVSPDDAGVPSPALLMMVLVGGKDRTLSEFRALARTARLDVRATGRQASGRYLVECSGNVDQSNYGLMSAADWDGVPLTTVLDRIAVPRRPLCLSSRE